MVGGTWWAVGGGWYMVGSEWWVVHGGVKFTVMLDKEEKGSLV